MRLKIGKSCRVHLSDGSGHDVTVIRYESDDWYRVKSALGEFFLNRRQAVRVHES
jgi:hypothetical protein